MNFNNLKSILHRHRYALVVACFVAGIAGMPQLVVRSALGPDDRGIPMLVNDSEGEYLTRVQEILNGHFSVASPMLHEYKDSVAIMPPMGEFIFYALPVMITGLPLAAIVVVSKFLYPALLFLFSYLFIYSLLNRRDGGAQASAIAGALLIVLGYDAFDYRNFITAVLHGVQDSSGLLWNRLVNPITGGVLLFCYLWLLVRIAKGRSGWITIGAPGLILAGMTGYIFSFALGLTITTVISFYFIYRRNWALVQRVIAPAVFALALNAWYFIGVYRAMQGVVLLGDPKKAGMLFTNEPLVNLISLALIGGVALAFLLFYKKDTSSEVDRRWWYIAGATALACEIVYNQQIITGRTVWPQHFVQYTTPLAMAIGSVFVHNILRRYISRVWGGVVVFIALIALIFGVRGFLDATQYTLTKYSELQSFSGVIEYLNTHAEKDCVVYVSPAYPYPSEINRFIPALTHCDTYHTFYIYSGIPDERIMHNYLVNLRLRDIPLKNVKEYFFAPENYFYTQSYFYRDWLDMLCCDKWTTKFGDPEDSVAWFASVEADVEKRYAQFLRGDLYAQLTSYRIDYMVVNTEEQARVNPTRYAFLELKGQFGKYAVYEVRKP